MATSEFLVHFKITIPPGTSQSLVSELYEAEAKAAEPFLKSGHFRRVWREPGTRNHYALWAAPDANFIHEVYTSFPLWQAGYAEADVRPLASNANDPGWPGADPTEVTVNSGEPTAHLNGTISPDWIGAPTYAGLPPTETGATGDLVRKAYAAGVKATMDAYNL